MELLLGSATPEARDTLAAAYESMRDEKRGTQIETRVHQRQCVQCRRWFWAWDSERFRCFVCDAPRLGSSGGSSRSSTVRQHSVDRRGARALAAPVAPG